LWGKNIDNMPKLLMDRLSKGCRITISLPHWGKKAKKTIGIDEVRSLGFCAVTYPGSAKYRTKNSAAPDRALEWDEIPDNEPLVRIEGCFCPMMQFGGQPPSSIGPTNTPTMIFQPAMSTSQRSLRVSCAYLSFVGTS
jgi:hypothetical protein